MLYIYIQALTNDVEEISNEFVDITLCSSVLFFSFGYCLITSACRYIDCM